MELFTISLEQLKRLSYMLDGSKIEQSGDNIIVKTTFTDYRGSMSDGDTRPVRIVYEVRRDGKRRMLSRGRTWAEESSWIDPTKRDSRREWH
jgi:hypothetical protein